MTSSAFAGVAQSGARQRLTAAQQAQQQAFDQSIPGRIQKILTNIKGIEALPVPKSYDALWVNTLQSNLDGIKQIRSEYSQLKVREQTCDADIQKLGEAEGKLVKMLSEQSYYHSLERVSGYASLFMQDFRDVFAPVAAPVLISAKQQEDLNPAQNLINSCKKTFANGASKVGGWVGIVADKVANPVYRHVTQPAATAVADYFTTNYPTQTETVVGFKNRVVTKVTTVYPQAKAMARNGVVFTSPLIDSAKGKTADFLVDTLEPALRGDVAPGVVAAAAVMAGSGFTLMAPVAGVAVSLASKIAKDKVTSSKEDILIKKVEDHLLEEIFQAQHLEAILQNADALGAQAPEVRNGGRKVAAAIVQPRVVKEDSDSDDEEVEFFDAEEVLPGHQNGVEESKEKEAATILAGLAQNRLAPVEEEPGAAEVEVYDVVEIDRRSGYRVDSAEHKGWTEL
jgi:hypothetical protein